MINTRPYLEYANHLTDGELSLRSQISEWLPHQIIDVHAHCNLPEHVLKLDNAVTQHMMSTFPHFSIEESLRFRELLYPGRSVQTIRFANAYRGIDHRAANEYLLKHSPERDRMALYGLPDDPEYTNELLALDQVCGLKMYYQYFNPPATTIFQVFPREILEQAQKYHKPIILHLPRMIVHCVSELEEVLQDFPRLPVVLAHLGLPHLPVPGLMEAYQTVAEYPNVYMDTSMIPSTEVTLMALQTLGPSRILYGSDEPLNLIRSKVFNHPTRGQRLITHYPYHWVDQSEHEEFKHLAVDVMQTHWQVLNAIHEAVIQLPLKVQRRALEAIFYLNAVQVFGF